MLLYVQAIGTECFYWHAERKARRKKELVSAREFHA